MQFIGIPGPRPRFLTHPFDGRRVENAKFSIRGGTARASGVNRLCPPFLQRRVVQKRIGLCVEDLVRQRRRLRQITRDAFNRAAFNPLEQSNQPINVHRLRQTIFNRLPHEWMVRDFAVACDVFETGELIGKHTRDEVLSLHALQRRGNFASAPLAREGQSARRVPAPADRKHRRVQQRLHQKVADRLAVEITKDFIERKGMLRSQRENNCVVRRRRLQFEIKRAAKPFAQCQPPGAVHPDAERGVDDQLHSAGLVEEPFHHDFLLRRNDPERPESRAEVIRELARAGFAKTGLRS